MRSTNEVQAEYCDIFKSLHMHQSVNILCLKVTKSEIVINFLHYYLNNFFMLKSSLVGSAQQDAAEGLQCLINKLTECINVSSLTHLD